MDNSENESYNRVRVRSLANSAQRLKKITDKDIQQPHRREKKMVTQLNMPPLLIHP